jgi:hypothetical protein
MENDVQSAVPSNGMTSAFAGWVKLVYGSSTKASLRLAPNVTTANATAATPSL